MGEIADPSALQPISHLGTYFLFENEPEAHLMDIENIENTCSRLVAARKIYFTNITKKINK